MQALMADLPELRCIMQSCLGFVTRNQKPTNQSQNQGTKRRPQAFGLRRAARSRNDIDGSAIDKSIAESIGSESRNGFAIDFRRLRRQLRSWLRSEAAGACRERSSRPRGRVAAALPRRMISSLSRNSGDKGAKRRGDNEY